VLEFIDFFFGTIPHRSSSIEHNQSFRPLLVEDPVAASTASYVVIWFDLYLFLAVGTEVLNTIRRLPFRVLIFFFIHHGFFMNN